MYQFREIDQTKTDSRQIVDELSINGKPLSDVVPGYRQLSVNGRGLMGYIIDTTDDIPLRDGALANYQNLPPRELVIEYALKRDTSEELRQSFDKLNEFLTLDNTATERFDITFEDEPNWHYFGLLSDVEDFDETQNEITSSYTLYCPDPWKYSAQKSGTTVSLTYAYQVLPDELTVTLEGTSDEIIFKSGDNSFRLKGSFPTTQSNQLHVRYDDDQVRVFLGTADRTTTIAWTTYPETFYLEDGSEVTAELKVGGRTIATKNASIKWRDKAK